MEKKSKDIHDRGERLGVHLQDESFIKYEERVLAAEKHRRDKFLLLIAFFSSVASMLSAAAAWIAALNKLRPNCLKSPPK